MADRFRLGEIHPLFIRVPAGLPAAGHTVLDGAIEKPGAGPSSWR